MIPILLQLSLTIKVPLKLKRNKKVTKTDKESKHAIQSHLLGNSTQYILSKVHHCVGPTPACFNGPSCEYITGSALQYGIVFKYRPNNYIIQLY